MIAASPVQLWRFAIALVLAIALVCAPRLNAIAHDPAVLAALEAERHAALGTSDRGNDHGHSHDDADPAERKPGHVHGHDPFDHSHDTGQPGLFAPGLGMYPRAPPQPVPSTVHDDGLKDRLERPPRTLS
jgi:hypothetical protein